MGLLPAPVSTAVALFALQTAAVLTADFLMLQGCPADPAVADNANADLIPLFLIVWLVCALGSLFLAAKHLYTGLRAGP